MSNPNELAQARRKATNAANELQWIMDLPRIKGSCIKWSNGCVWKRHGDDDWRVAYFPDERYNSAHVASANWEPATKAEWEESRTRYKQDGDL